MVIRKAPRDENKGILVILSEDKIGRSDARLVSLINRVGRAIGRDQIESTYHCEDTYKQDTSILTFDWDRRDEVAKVARSSNFAVSIDE